MIDIKKLIHAPKDLATMVTRKSATRAYAVDGIAVNKKSGQAYNISIQMDTETMEVTSKVKVMCTCDDFKFRWAAVLHTQGALLNPKNFRLDPPKVTNPDNIQNACKHIHAFMQNEMAGKLKTFSPRKGTL